ncbi:hypothetical protein DKG71_00945 [Streptomyces sp. NEAU-S7GS2]|nr:hypothetical protein DKG71_00945 [Streptomyces sp. NEAU-S7GS2]
MKKASTASAVFPSWLRAAVFRQSCASDRTRSDMFFAFRQVRATDLSFSGSPRKRSPTRYLSIAEVSPMTSGSSFPRPRGAGAQSADLPEYGSDVLRCPIAASMSSATLLSVAM